MSTKKIGQYSMSLLLLVSSLWAVSTCAITLNVTESLSNRLFFLKKANDFQVGDTVFFQPEFSSVPFVKIIAGTFGDRITVHNQKFYINDIYQGDVIADIRAIQSQSIPKDYYFVKGEHPRSLDSRYEQVGLVHKSELQYKGFALDGVLDVLLGKHWGFK